MEVVILWQREHPAIMTLLGRRSIRRFENRPVPEEAVALILECACAAPTAANNRPWHFVVVDDRGKLDALAGVLPYGKALFQAPLAVVVCGDPTKSDMSRAYWEEDCSAAMENIRGGAWALGIGSVWLGIHPVPGRPEAVRQILDIPGSGSVLGIAALGYPGEEKEPHAGVDPGVVHQNRW